MEEGGLRVFGIDPGSRHCGFGVVEAARDGRLRHVAHGVLALGERLSIEARLLALHEGLSRELERHRPGMVALEDVFTARHPRGALVLGQARGVALLAAAQARIEIRNFAPAAIKQIVTGSGRAEKGQVGRMVSMLLGVSIEGRADAADALAAAICGLLRAPDPARGAMGRGSSAERRERIEDAGAIGRLGAIGRVEAAGGGGASGRLGGTGRDGASGRVDVVARVGAIVRIEPLERASAIELRAAVQARAARAAEVLRLLKARRR